MGTHDILLKVKNGEISLEEYYLLKECEGLDVWV